MSKRRQKLRPKVKVNGDIISLRFERRFDILCDRIQHEHVAGRRQAQDSSEMGPSATTEEALENLRRRNENTSENCP